MGWGLTGFTLMWPGEDIFVSGYLEPNGCDKHLGNHDLGAAGSFRREYCASGKQAIFHLGEILSMGVSYIIHVPCLVVADGSSSKKGSVAFLWAKVLSPYSKSRCLFLQGTLTWLVPPSVMEEWAWNNPRDPRFILVKVFCTSGMERIGGGPDGDRTASGSSRMVVGSSMSSNCWLAKSCTTSIL